MLNDVTSWLLALGPLGVFLISVLDSVAIPIPQGVDALIIAQAVAAPQTAYWVASLAVLGSILGSSTLYFMARRAGQVMLERKVSKSGIEKMREKIRKFGALVLLFPTMIPLPLPMKLFVIAGGVFQIKFTHFLLVITAARCVRYFVEAFIAVRYGEEATLFLKEHVAVGAMGLILLIAISYGIHRWSTQRVNQGT